jgi:hypothetical protein
MLILNAAGRALGGAARHLDIFGLPIKVPLTPTIPGVSLLIRVTLEGQNETIHPYICFGFKIQDALVYLSDVSYIPEGTWSMLEAQREYGTLP